VKRERPPRRRPTALGAFDFKLQLNPLQGHLLGRGVDVVASGFVVKLLERGVQAERRAHRAVVKFWDGAIVDGVGLPTANAVSFLASRTFRPRLPRLAFPLDDVLRPRWVIVRHSSLWAATPSWPRFS
jgi:hypothetical protein